MPEYPTKPTADGSLGDTGHKLGHNIIACVGNTPLQCVIMVYDCTRFPPVHTICPASRIYRCKLRSSPFLVFPAYNVSCMYDLIVISQDMNVPYLT